MAGNARTYLINTRPPKWSKLHRLVCIEEVTIRSSKMLFAVERVLMDTNQRQIALSVLESLRDDLMYAHLNNGGRVLDVADLRQYIYEQIARLRTKTFVMVGLYVQDNDHALGISKAIGHIG